MLNVAYTLLAEGCDAAKLEELDLLLEDESRPMSREEQRAQFLAITEGGRV